MWLFDEMMMKEITGRSSKSDELWNLVIQSDQMSSFDQTISVWSVDLMWLFDEMILD